MNRSFFAGLWAVCILVLSSCTSIPAERMTTGVSMITVGGTSPNTKWEEIPLTTVETKSLVYMLTYVRWEPADSEAGSHDLRWVWYSGEKIVHQCDAKGVQMKVTPYRAWCRTQAAGLGVGHIRVQFYLDGRFMASNEFDIVDINSKSGDANSHANYVPASAGGENSLVARCPNAVTVAKDIGFPLDAAAKGFTSGSVVMALVLTPDSHVHDVRVVSSTDPSFNQAAIDAVLRLKCSGAGLAKDTELRWQMEYTGN